MKNKTNRKDAKERTKFRPKMLLAWLVLIVSFMGLVCIKTFESTTSSYLLSFLPVESSKVAISIIDEVIKLLFVTSLASIFIDRYRIVEQNRIMSDLKGNAFYHAFDIKLPEKIQDLIRSQLFERKIYRKGYKLTYYFTDHKEDQLVVTAVSSYTVVNAVDYPIKHKIERDVEKSSGETETNAILNVDGKRIEMIVGESQTPNHERYTYEIVIPAGAEITVSVTTKTKKSTCDSDALYCLIIADSMEVEVVFQCKQEFNCTFFSLCQNDRGNEDFQALSKELKNVYKWNCPNPLLAYQGVKVEWSPKHLE